MSASTMLSWAIRLVIASVRNCVSRSTVQPQRVMPGLVPGIHAEQGPQFWEIECSGAAWMAGTSPAMTAANCLVEKPCRFPARGRGSLNP
jgi:hypothetical protein